MARLQSLRALLPVSALCIAGLAFGQATEQGQAGAAAEKAASTKKSTAATKPAAGKRLDFAPTTPVTGAAAQGLAPTATQMPSGATKEKSGCHHGGSDA